MAVCVCFVDDVVVVAVDAVFSFYVDPTISEELLLQIIANKKYVEFIRGKSQSKNEEEMFSFH
jgi:hypothetical protein